MTPAPAWPACRPRRRTLAALAVAWAAGLGPALAAPRDDLGVAALAAALGAQAPTGAGVLAAQVEVPEEGGAFAPDPALFPAVAFDLRSPAAAGFSGHANTVGTYLYGSANLAPALGPVQVWEANHFLGAGYLRLGGALLPLTPAGGAAPLQNHSWIGTFDDDALDAEALRRLDYHLERADVLAVVGTNNGSGNPVPRLLVSAHNVLAVGLANGGHAAGLVDFDGGPRTRPDVVGPAATGTTSFATGAVTAVAALLRELALREPSLTPAAGSLGVRALLLAGARRTDFPAWAAHPANGYDLRYGAGHADAFRSWQALAAGPSAADGATENAPRGWWRGDLAPGGPVRLRFRVPDGQRWRDGAAALAWHRRIRLGGKGVTWNSATPVDPAPALRLFAVSETGARRLLRATAPTGGAVAFLAAELPRGLYEWELDPQATAAAFPLAAAFHGDLDTPPATFAAWAAAVAAAHPDRPVPQAAADSDGDGLTDLAEFALGTDVHVRDPAAHPALVVEPAGAVRLVFTRRAEDAETVTAVELRQDGGDWTAFSPPAEAVEVWPRPDGQTMEVSVTLPAPAPGSLLLARVRVARP